MTPTTFTPTVTRFAGGVACLLALTIIPAPALAQSRGAPPRHGTYGVIAPARVVSPRFVAPVRVRGPFVSRSVRGPYVFRGPTHFDSFVVRRSYRPYVSHAYVARPFVSRPFVSRSYGARFYGPSTVVVAQQRHGAIYRGRPYYPYYRPYYRYPRTYVSFGLGFGYPYGFLGYPFYGPAWYGPSWYPYGYFGAFPFYGYGYGYGYGGYPGRYWSEYAEDQGGIRLQVTPKDATVYVDGYYVGIVDDFDGSSQHLTLDAGQHKLEIRAPGFETLTLDVNILRNETIRYRGTLRPLP